MRKLNNLSWKKYFLTTSPILLILLVALIYWGFETYQGTQHLKESDQLLIDEGVNFNFAESYAELPPAGDNFAESKYIRSCLEFDPITGISLHKVDHDKLLDAIDTPYEWRHRFPSWPQGNLSISNTVIGQDLSSLKGATTQDKLQSLIDRDPAVIQEIDSKVDCRNSAFHPKLNEENPATALIPYATDFQKLGRFNLLRASLAIERNDRETALNCLKTNLHLVELCNSTPTLISLHLKHILSSHTETIILMGMINGLWQATDYQDFIDWLPTTEHRVSEATKLVNGELIGYRKAIEFYISASQKARKETISMMGMPKYEWWHFTPKGTLKHNIVYAQEGLFYDFYLPLKQMDFSTTPPYSFPSKNKARTTLAEWFSGSSGKLKTRLAQSLVHEKLTRLACAIKLYEIETGELPISLAALAPKYINDNTNDLMNPGHSLIYRIDSKAKKHWTLYSVGQNLTDEGGKPEWDTQRNRDFSKGDWVLSMPLFMQKP